MRRLPLACGTLVVVMLVSIAISAHDAIGAMGFCALGYLLLAQPQKERARERD